MLFQKLDSSPAAYLGMDPFPYRVAIIDLGTNSVRLDIYEFHKKSVFRIRRDKYMIRLGDGVFETNMLPMKNFGVAFDAFREMNNTMTELKVKRVVCFATSAMRTAKNAHVFTAFIKKSFGINVRVISGNEEAQLIAQGVRHNVDMPTHKYALVDIGGGSTEISIGIGNRLVSCQSYPLGANRLQQIFLNSKSSVKYPHLELRLHVRKILHDMALSARKIGVEAIVGSSGTIRAIDKMIRKREECGRFLKRSQVSALVSDICFLSKEELVDIPGLEYKRADLIVPGAVLFEEILLAFDVNRFCVTEYSMRDGVLCGEMLRAGLPLGIPVRWRR